MRQALICAALRESRLFGELSADEVREVAEISLLKRYPKGAYLFRRGQAADGFFVVQSGAVNVHRVSPGGREQVIHVFRPYDVFAEVVLATGDAYPADAAALEDTQVVLIRRDAFRDLIMRKPDLSLRMLASMSVHLKDLVQTLEDLKGRQIEGRLASWLLRQGQGKTGASPSRVRLETSKKVLAGQLGVTSETLSRAFAKFRDEGLINVAGPEVALLDRGGLERYARE